MIKLKQLYSEIRLINKVTPEMVIELAETLPIISQDIVDIVEKYAKNLKEGWPAWVYKLNKNQLVALYHDLLKLKKEIGLNEIRLINGPTPEIIVDVFNDLAETEYEQDIWHILEKYLDHLDFNHDGWSIEDLEELPKQKLNNLYRELIVLKNKLNEIKIIKPIDALANVTYTVDGINSYETFDRDKIISIFHKYYNYLKETIEREDINEKCDEYINAIDDFGDIRDYKDITIKELLDGFKLYIEHS